MSLDVLEYGLLLGGWTVAFLLGRELQTGYSQWRTRTARRKS